MKRTRKYIIVEIGACINTRSLSIQIKLQMLASGTRYTFKIRTRLFKKNILHWKLLEHAQFL